METSEVQDGYTWQELGAAVLGRWRLVLVNALVAGILAAGIVLLVPRTHVALLSLRVGKVATLLLDDPATVALWVRSDMFSATLARQLGEKEPDDFLGTVTAFAEHIDTGSQRIASSVITIRAKGKDPDEATRRARAALAMVSAEHDRRYRVLMDQNRQYADRLTAQIEIVRAELREVEAGLKEFRRNPTVAAPAVLLMRAQLEEKQTQLMGFIKELRDIELGLLGHSEPTRALGEPVTPRRLVSPRRTLTVAAVTMTAGFFTVAWVALGAALRGRRAS